MSSVSRRERDRSADGFTLLEVVIASVILAIAVVAFGSVLAYQAGLRQQIAVRDQAYLLMQKNLKDCVNKASDYYYQDQDFNYNQYFQHPGPRPQVLPAYDNQPGFVVQNTIVPVLTKEAYTVSLGNGSFVYYNLYRISSTISWQDGARSVSGTTLVAPELLRQPAP